MKYFLLVILSIFSFSFIHSLNAFQTIPDETNPFTVIYDEGPIELNPGETKTLEVTISIPDNYDLYVDDFNLNIEQADNLQLGEIKKAPGEKKDDPFLGRVVDVYYNLAKLTLTVTAPKETWIGEKILVGDIQYQGCSDQLCYRPMHTPFKVVFKMPVATSGIIGSTMGDQSEQSFFQKIKKAVAQGSFEEILKEGFWFALLLAFIGGVLTDFTPCVWPMIPITLAHLGVKKGKSWFQNMVAVFFLMLGMALMYSVLGMSAALLGKGLGFFFQNTGFLVLLTLVLFVMAFSFLGFFEIRLPSSLLTKVSNLSAKGYLGDFLVGLTMGIIAAPCVGPVMGPLLAFVAKTKDVVAGFWLLLFYAFGMSSLFFVIAALHGSVPKKLRAGAWTLWFERFLGIILLLVGLSYARVLYFELRGGEQNLKSDYWISSFNEGVDKAREEHKPILVDFYAQWCAPCKELERKVWNHPVVTEELKQNWVAIHIDCTQETDECKQAVDRFEVVGWPTVLFLDQNQKELIDDRLVGKVVSPDEMLQILRKLEKQ